MASVTNIKSRHIAPQKTYQIDEPIGSKPGDKFYRYEVDEENTLRFAPGTVLIFLQAPFTSDGLHVIRHPEGFAYPAVIKAIPNGKLYMESFHDDIRSGEYNQRDLNIIGELWEVYPAKTPMRFVNWRKWYRLAKPETDTRPLLVGVGHFRQEKKRPTS